MTATECTAPVHGTAEAYTRHRCRCASARAAMRPDWRIRNRRRAGRRPDGTPTTWLCHHDVDEVAVYRAVRGERIRLGATERQLAVAELTGRLSAAEIAHRLGCHLRTVQRHQARLARTTSPAKENH